MERFFITSLYIGLFDKIAGGIGKGISNAAGKYPSDDMLYKIIDGRCYKFESCEPFGGGEGCLSVTFGLREPNGGFDYKKEDEKPQKKSGGLFGLFRK